MAVAKATTNKNGHDTLADVSNDAMADIIATAPYAVHVVLEGSSAILFHRWSVEAIAEKAAAAKGSKMKKEDNIESYVWRCPDGSIGVPGEYVRQAIVTAAKYRQDPRSPRKSAMDLYKAGVVSLTDVATLGKDTWDYLDARRVTVMRAGITRFRPAFMAGWRCEFDIQVLLPQYINPLDLHTVLSEAGRLVGLGDFRPTFGRFAVVSFSESK